MRVNAKRRVEGNNNTKAGEDMDNDAMMEEIGAGCLTESDVKYDEAVYKFIIVFVRGDVRGVLRRDLGRRIVW